jgi:hypothetical protein
MGSNRRLHPVGRVREELSKLPILSIRSLVVSLTHRRNWGEDRVYYQDEDGGLRSLPAHWTDVVPPDPFCAISAGRAHFRPADLQALANLIQGLQAAERGESPQQNRK